ncbi:VOC family protein [Primorskyibacter sp. S187A]|uniref:VOC family protein n=1 Tax=Primorskyibacter sp. S187A TaxID=3415130 RepID=UPI003C7D5429
MRLLHVSLTARDARALAQFYRCVFDLTLLRPPREMSGPEIGESVGLPGAAFLSIWLGAQDQAAPFLEIIEYRTPTAPEPQGALPLNTPGRGHVAVAVADLEGTLARVLRHGGSAVGPVTTLGDDAARCRLVMIRDPEGNVVELEARG